MALFSPTIVTTDALTPSWSALANVNDGNDTTIATSSFTEIIGGSFRTKYVRCSGWPSVTTTNRTLEFVIRATGTGTSGSNVNGARLNVSYTTDGISIPGPFSGTFETVDQWLFEASHESGIIRKSIPLSDAIDSTKLMAQASWVKFDEASSGAYTVGCFAYEIYLGTPFEAGNTGEIIATMF